MSSRPSQYTLTAPGKVRLWSTAELLTLPPPTWLIEGVIPNNGLVGLIAQPGVGKTFLAIDMALSVACGGSWQGHTIGVGQYVLYISAEGGMGIGKRVQAWLSDRGVEPRQAKMAWLIEPISIHNDSDGIDRLIKRINKEVEIEPALVVIDTLARCFDGDENQQEDMGRFIAGVDYLRQEWDATVIVVHHTRLDGERERGNTAFRGAADTMLAVERTTLSGPKGGNRVHGLTLTCNKQKDAEEFKAKRLKLVKVDGTDSCVIECGHPVRSVGRPPSTGQAKEVVLAALAECGPISWTGLKDLVELPKSTFNRFILGLELSGCVQRTSSDDWELGPNNIGGEK